MQTLCDFLMGTYYCCIFWNGEIAVVGSPDVFGRLDALTPMGEMYYSVAPRARAFSYYIIHRSCELIINPCQVWVKMVEWGR